MLTLSPAFSAASLGELIQLTLPEPFPLPLFNLSPNPVTSLSDFVSLSPPDHSLSPEPFPPLESEFAVNISSPKPLVFLSLPPLVLRKRVLLFNQKTLWLWIPSFLILPLPKISTPYLKPCLNPSPYYSLRSNLRFIFNTHSQSYHLVPYPRLGSVEYIFRVNQTVSLHLKFNSWKGMCCRSNMKVVGFTYCGTKISGRILFLSSQFYLLPAL